MEILRGLDSLPDPRVRNSFVTWGVFDGVHRGHAKVLRALAAKGAPTLVVTFDRHPAEVLHGRDVPLVLPLEERLKRLAEASQVLVLPFTKEFAETTAEQFVRDIIVGRIGARGILLGHDSHFGKDRKGDIELLATLGRELGIEVDRCEPEVHGGRPLSSSRIREAVSAGRLDEAAEMLGRPFAVYGTVVRGDGRGAKLGFPTANVRPALPLLPPPGVYQVETLGRKAVANLGRRPTFHEAGPLTLEVHILDFRGDLYDRELEVRFLRKIRDERKFSGPEEIRRQIEADIHDVR
jgi:riboflavin kinase / FMN adenylyltransferase